VNGLIVGAAARSQLVSFLQRRRDYAAPLGTCRFGERTSVTGFAVVRVGIVRMPEARGERSTT
jgi:hypothetical protein